MHESIIDLAGERMCNTDKHPTPSLQQATRFRYAFAFQVAGDIKFISHQDTLRMFKRAIARAQLPIAYSEGFNPQPRVSIPLPRPVGIASLCEQLVVTMAQEIERDHAVAQFRSKAPVGVTITDCMFLAQGRRLIPSAVMYVLPIMEGDPVDLLESIGKLLDANTLVVSRFKVKKSEVTSVDIRPFIENICVENDRLVLRLHVTDRGTAKPSEIAGLLGYDANSINHRIQRINIAWLE